MHIDWNNPESDAIDGFTVGDIMQMATDDVVTAKCRACGAEAEVEPDAKNYPCHACGTKRAVTSPLRKLGIVKPTTTMTSQGKSAWVNFAEVRAKVSLEDVIVRYYRLETFKRQGDKMIGPCPIHNGDSPRAFHAELSRNVWHCFSRCQRGGNQIDFVSLKDGVTVREAALRLKAFFLGDGGATAVPKAASSPASATPTTVAPSPGRGDARDDDADAPVEREGNPSLDIELSLKAEHPHLTDDRKLSVETIRHFGIGYCSRGIMRGTIAIPVHDEAGRLVAYAGRRLRPSDIAEFGKYKLPKGFRKELVLFNYHRAKALGAEKGIVLVEGFFSVVTLHQAGVTNVVASMGCQLSKEQAAQLSAAKEVIVLFDGNEAGKAGTDAAVALLTGKVKTRVVCLPDNTTPDDLSPQAVRWLVNGMQALDLARIAFEFSPKP